MTLFATIFGCSGLALNEAERAFFREAKPWGFILFKRNVDDPSQVRALCAELRESVGYDAPILIDQEGGRVQRLREPHWPTYPPGRAYANPALPMELRERAARLGARLIARDLAALGVDVDCLPVLDVPVTGAHDVIGDRAYGDDPTIVARLGRAAAQGLLDEGVLPVAKHIPGHGRAGVDSHLALPVVDASREELERRDFAPFRELADLPLAMTAHVVYTAIDPEHCATHSRRVIADVIRGHIGFDGLLMSDDVGMQALAGDFAERTRTLFSAGCDLALHCSGVMEEMIAVASEARPLSAAAERRSRSALGLRNRGETDFDPVDARAELDALLAARA
ncbi:MAG: beta-N-acetylhexosaminidase [Salinarimonadaceae bacterium]|nr:MAG: beta-N-acetylhexosaminidase [Salinarimonadaceae bacterium]